MPGAIRPFALGNCPAHDKRMNNFVKRMVNTRAHKKGRLKYVRACNYVKSKQEELKTTSFLSMKLAAVSCLHIAK